MIGPDDEAPRRPTGPGFSEAVTIAFGDADAGCFGVARVGLSGADGALASGLAVLFADREPVAVRAEGGEVAARADDWSTVVAGGVSTRVVEPLASWTVAFDGGEDGGFSLACTAVSRPGELDPTSAAARIGGMVGYEQVVAVRGTVRVGSSFLEVDCLGQRGHSWGEPDWGDLVEARTITAWAGPSLAASAVALRQAGARAHDRDAVAATFFGPEGPVAIADARLSTTLDGDGRQRRASMELYASDEDSVAVRAAGQVVCGTTLDLGRLALDTSFFAWSFEGHPAVGRFDVLRRPA